MTASLFILDAGSAVTVQDCGRPSYQRFGVPAGGALDKVSLQIANVLAGNPSGEAALEIYGGGFAARVDADSVTLALAGTAAPFIIETGTAISRVPPFQNVTACRGAVLRFPPPKNGAACYVAAAGGFDVPAVLGSKSTDRRASLGGYYGRPLRAGDALPLCLAAAPAGEPAALHVSVKAPKVLRVMRGPNADYFKPAAFETLFASAYTVVPASDRMGLRLQGPPLERATGGELPPQGTIAGALQVPADGQPILLLADRQTTGGYPCIATVIGADAAAAGRLSPAMSVRFEEVSRDEAVALLKAQRDWLASLPALLRPVAAHDAPTTERLLSCNLIGGVTTGAAEEC